MIKTQSTTTNPADIEVGDFIDIPTWQTFGCVVGVGDAHYGSDDARRITLQEDPDRENDLRVYQLEPGEFHWT